MPTYINGVQENSLVASLGASLTTSGQLMTLTAAQTTAFGDICYVNSSGTATLVNASTIAGASALVMCADAAGNSSVSGNWLVYGTARNDSWNWGTIGGFIYATITGTTGNTLSQTAPVALNNSVQIVGIALSAHVMFFDPNMPQVEILA